MKKQILFLAMLTLTLIFAGTNVVFGQVDDPDLDALPASCPVPAPLTNCATGDELHPVAGAEYTYVVDHTGGAGSVVHWFVANDNTDLITAGAITATIDAGDGNGAYILNTDAAVYNQGTTATTPNTSASIDITWKMFNATENVVLVAFVTDAAGCTNNIEAWKIEPEYSFIIEIAGIMPDGTFTYGAGNTNANECVSPVQSAVWDGTDIAMDYGDNYIFFNVTAANWVHSWLPEFNVTDNTGGSTLGDVEWAYAHEANDPAAATWHAATVPVSAAEYTSAVNDAIGPNGACIVLRVLVTHATNEIDVTGANVVVSVDGDMWNSETSAHDDTYPDLDDAAASGGTCVVGSNDDAQYDLTPRPNITPDTPTDPFVTKN